MPTRITPIQHKDVLVCTLGQGKEIQFEKDEI